MRILHVLPSLNSITGGPARSIPMQLRGLARLGFDVELFTTRWPEIEPEGVEHRYEEGGIRIRTFSATPLWPVHHVPYSRGLVAAFRATAHEMDLLHVSSIWNPLASHVLGIARAREIPYAITPHGMLDPIVFARHRFAKALWAAAWERRNVEAARLIHFMSEREAEKAAGCGWQLPDTVVMPVLVDVVGWRRLPPRDQIERELPGLAGREVVLFVGRINWVKNLDLLVRAVAELAGRGRDVALLCVGPDSDGHRRELENLATQLGIHDRVTFTGLLEGDRLRAAYSRADTVALVSQKENFGIAAADGLAAGVPVVLSDGVDMGEGWRPPAVWRVRPDVAAIAEGLRGGLDVARVGGLPNAPARQLAEREWANVDVSVLGSALLRAARARPVSRKGVA